MSSTADIIFLGVKPQVLASVINDIKNNIKDRSVLIVSMAAGIDTEKIQNMLVSIGFGDDQAIRSKTFTKRY